MRLSYILIALGIAFLLLGCGASLTPFSMVSTPFGTIEDISPISATLIGVGVIILGFGVVLYLKDK